MLAVAAIMATMSASAQFEPGKWSIDINIGLGASWLNKSEEMILNGYELDKQVAPSALIGLGASYQVNQLLGLSAGVNWAVQGQGWDDLRLGDVKYNNNSLELTYVQIPVMAHVYFYKGWSVNAGIQPSFLVNADQTCNIKNTSGERTVKTDTRIDYMDDMKKFDLSIPLGISYEFKGHFVLGAQYNLGLSTVNKKTLSNKDMKNGAILLTLGWRTSL